MKVDNNLHKYQFRSQRNNMDCWGTKTDWKQRKFHRYLIRASITQLSYWLFSISFWFSLFPSLALWVPFYLSPFSFSSATPPPPPQRESLMHTYAQCHCWYISVNIFAWNSHDIPSCLFFRDFSSSLASSPSQKSAQLKLFAQIKHTHTHSNPSACNRYCKYFLKWLSKSNRRVLYWNKLFTPVHVKSTWKT